MVIIGWVLFYFGFFGFFIGLGAVIRGDLQIIKITNRKEALMLMLLSIVFFVIGSNLIVGQ